MKANVVSRALLKSLSATEFSLAGHARTLYCARRLSQWIHAEEVRMQVLTLSDLPPTGKVQPLKASCSAKQYHTHGSR